MQKFNKRQFVKHPADLPDDMFVLSSMEASLCFIPLQRFERSIHQLQGLQPRRP